MSDYKEVELDGEAVNAIAEKVADKLDIAKTIADASEQAIAKFVEATEKTIKKDIEAPAEKQLKKGYADMPKEVRLVKQVVALRDGDYSALREINSANIELAEKAGYGNIGTNADGKYVVPDPDFEAEVERLEEEYGVASRYADNRTINGNSVKLNKKGTSGVSLSEVGEASAISGTKLSIAQVTGDLRKFAGIAPITNELNEDSAIDFWAEVTTDFARERARVQDSLVFTDATSGILEQAGIHTVGVGSANITDITWEDLLDAETKVPTMSANNGVWFMHRSVVNVLRKLRAGGSATGDGQFLFAPSKDMVTPWGTTIVPVEVLPSTTVGGGANAGYAVFGDLRNVKLYTKRGIVFSVLTEGTVKDADGTDFNLATQDGQALRAVTRMLAVTKFSNAFAVVGTGTVS
jgi:HK97 family phage major capsid protein